MSVQSSTFYNVLDQSSNCVFFDKPSEIQINEEAVTRYATSQKIEVLIEELQGKGPLIALGKFGPTFYVDIPFKLKDKVCEKDIFGWKPGAERTNFSGQNSLLILGAKKNVEREYVYFTLSQDITPNKNTYIRQHKPSNTDTKIYVVSHKTFRDFLFDLYSPVPTSTSEPLKESPIYYISSQPKGKPELSISEREYAEKLSSIMPLDSILDMGEGERNCKEIGQKAFDEFKRKANGNSTEGKVALQKICNSIAFIAHDGFLRKQYIERAWAGIGDENWRWHA